MSAASRRVARAALYMAMTETHPEEQEQKHLFATENVRATAVDFGGDFVSSVRRIVERAVVAAKREGVISAVHSEEGAVAGATHEALLQMGRKAVGLSVGGKIGIARKDDHVAVAVFFGVGLGHLDEVAVGLAHRAVS